jgi:hypothetical protein
VTEISVGNSRIILVTAVVLPYIVPCPLSSTSFAFFTQCQTTTFFKSLLTPHGTDRVEEYLKTESEGESKRREKYCNTDF